MTAGKNVSGSTGNTQTGPVVRPAAAAGAAHVKGGAATTSAGPKAGPRPQASGSSGG